MEHSPAGKHVVAGAVVHSSVGKYVVAGDSGTQLCREVCCCRGQWYTAL